MCSNCHSLSSTGIRPLKRFFPSNVNETTVFDYLGAGLYRGHTIYMPAMPLPESERKALAAYISSVVKTSNQQ